jgi:hypothetical protein
VRVGVEREAADELVTDRNHARSGHAANI